MARTNNGALYVDHELDDAARHAIRSSIGEAYPLDGQPHFEEPIQFSTTYRRAEPE